MTKIVGQFEELCRQQGESSVFLFAWTGRMGRGVFWSFVSVGRSEAGEDQVDFLLKLYDKAQLKQFGAMGRLNRHVCWHSQILFFIVFSGWWSCHRYSWVRGASYLLLGRERERTNNPERCTTFSGLLLPWKPRNCLALHVGWYNCFAYARITPAVHSPETLLYS